MKKSFLMIVAVAALACAFSSCKTKKTCTCIDKTGAEPEQVIDISDNPVYTNCNQVIDLIREIAKESGINPDNYECK